MTPTPDRPKHKCDIRCYSDLAKPTGGVCPECGEHGLWSGVKLTSRIGPLRTPLDTSSRRIRRCEFCQYTEELDRAQ